MAYDYKESKKRVDEILYSKTEIVTKDVIPSSDSEFTYSNGIKSWVGAIFVDMVGSSDLCNTADEKTARIFRSFCSEIIAIMKEDLNYRQIGIRGDCVYSINTAHYRSDLVDMFDTAVLINTFMGMFRKQLENKGYAPVKAGIGLGCSEDLIIKAGQSGSGINDKIWIGKAVVEASKLGDKANRNGIQPIAMSTLFYDNVHENLEKRDERYKTWIEPHSDMIYSIYNTRPDFYHCDLVKTGFSDWINNNV
ncbi:hypothetical protein [Butyrivibrio fibrisolvens]|uniref:hypothetical protein n=1 Tax=Butyrivibrio fibrisolvens TaxID=831 RepID=UPI0004197FE7|nr:hypothetical protein [Butyrivibrio fibrisolvens]